MFDFDKIVSRKRAIKHKYGSDYYMLSTADMDFESAIEIKEALIKKANQGYYGYELKSAEYYNAIINWYQRHYQWSIKDEMIAVAPGIWVSLRLCLETFAKESDNILVHYPTFHPIVEIAKKSKRNLIYSELCYQDNSFEIDFALFEKQLQQNIKIFILINPHNPTGRVFTKEELTRIGNLCLKYNVLVISDEVHGGIVFADNKLLPFGSISNEFANNSIILNSASKAYNLQGLTHAYLVIPNKKHRAMFEETLQGYDLDFATNIFSMAALEAAYNGGDEWLKEVTSYLQNNLDYLDVFLKGELPQVKLIRPQGSYLAWLDISSLGLNNDEIKELFINKGKIYFSFEESFSLNEGKFVRLNFACPLVVLKEALLKIKEVIDNN